MDVRFARVMVFGPDTERLAAFYEGVLGFTRTYAGGGDIALKVPVGTGDGAIELYLHPGESRKVDVGTFDVTGLDATVDELRGHGVSVLAAPTDTPWGTREASIADPDGNTLLLTEGRADRDPARTPSPYARARTPAPRARRHPRAWTRRELRGIMGP